MALAESKLKKKVKSQCCRLWTIVYSGVHILRIRFTSYHISLVSIIMGNFQFLPSSF